MPTRPLSDELAREAAQAWLDCGKSQEDAAAKLGVNYHTFRHRLRVGKERGFADDPAIADAKRAVGTGLNPVLAWAKTKNEDGTSYSVLLRPPPVETESLIEQVKDALADLPAAPEITESDTAKDSDLLTLYPIADSHIGLLAWGKETGEDYDINTARDRLVNWMGRCVEASPPSGTAIVLDVGDLLHADDQTNQTPNSKHALDVDTRHYRTVDTTIAAMASAIELCAKRHARVIVRILPGNHNPTSYLAIMFALAERYRENPRIEVQKIPGEFFVHQFGSVLLAAHHGDKAKAERMVMFLADQYAAIWGRTNYRYLWTGHLHHHKSADIGGVTWEQLRALTARDAYAVAHSYTARAQLQAVTYHRQRGEVQRVKVGL
jgi:hypothetical protein